MPELPEVETIRSGLAPHLSGQRITRVQMRRNNLRYPLPNLMQLEGQMIYGVERRAKYLLFQLNSDATLVWHLGMTGQFHVLPQQSAAGFHEHVQIDLQHGLSLRYRDARRFGYAGLLATERMPQHPWFANLGPEPLSSQFDAEYLAAQCQGRCVAIKSRIMDASVVVGVGNIYAAESLFRAGIHPARAAGRIAHARLALLVDAIQSVLREAIAAGGSTISDFVHSDGTPGYFAHQFQVYGREGQPCYRCGHAIKKITQAGRSTHYCPRCQH